MGTLYIDRKDVELRREGARLLVYEQGACTGGIPVPHLERVVIYGRARLDTGVLGALAEHGVGLVTLNGRRRGRSAFMVGAGHNDVARRVAQYERFLDEDWRIRWSARLVAHKLRAQHRLLSIAVAARADKRHALTTALRSLEERLASFSGEHDPLTRDRIRGIEGAAAAAYFKGLASLFPPALGFVGRNRRPPRDPVNACLSLGYTLLYADAVFASHAAGLDPLLGFYHDPAFGRSSLATDFIEPLRPRLDEWVWRLFRERTLRAESFVHEKGACLLSKSARSVFYPDYDGFVQPLRRHLRRYAGILARSLAEEGDVYLDEEGKEL